MNTGRPTPRRSPVYYEILDYLADHPEAQDTVEGIVEWWLLKRQIKHRTVQVKKALIELVAQGLVVARKGRDAREHYRINHLKHREIVEHLKTRRRNG